MDAENEHRRVPTLVHLCQRAATSNADSIYSLGHLSYSLVKPILARCTADQLSRFEQLSPHLEADTSEIWRDLCFRKYQLTALERFSPNDDPHPDSWRSRFFTLQELEAQRIEEVGSKIRTQRLEADERKKEKEVKLTNRLPPAKRPRSGGFNLVSQPKTLFQKTRSEASKIQRALNARILPPPQSRNRLSPVASGSSQPSAVSPTVNVKSTSVHHVPASNSNSKVSDVDMKPPSSWPAFTTTPTPTPPPIELSTPLSSPSETPRPVPKMRSPAKRDPMASLFVPKRKPPQRPA